MLLSWPKFFLFVDVWLILLRNNIYRRNWEEREYAGKGKEGVANRCHPLKKIELANTVPQGPVSRAIFMA